MANDMEICFKQTILQNHVHRFWFCKQNLSGIVERVQSGGGLTGATVKASWNDKTGSCLEISSGCSSPGVVTLTVEDSLQKRFQTWKKQHDTI